MYNVKKKLDMVVHSKTAINKIVILVGVVFCLFGILIKNCHPDIFTVLLGVGCSLIATSIATWITASYTIKKDQVEDIIDYWGLENIYETKQEMNKDSNSDLDKVSNHIDIIAIGMNGFLTAKQELLEKALNKNVEIRILSCGNSEMLKQREKDESSAISETGTMKTEINELSKWVESFKNKSHIELRYYDTYPGISYLRIDNSVYFGSNLVRLKSQLNMAFKFSFSSKGGQYYHKYFEKLWHDAESRKIVKDWSD